jgi:hypothetical protein
VAFYDGTDYWLADGFHRQKAASRADMLDQFYRNLEVRKGSARGAALFSVGANARHGFPRSDDDKRRAVLRLVSDSEWSTWSDREIARRCHVHHCFVAKLRESVTGCVSSERAYITRHGTVAFMDTAAIGGKPKPRAEPAVYGGVSEPAVTEASDDFATRASDSALDLSAAALSGEEAAIADQAEPGEHPEAIGEAITEPAHNLWHQHITTAPAGELCPDLFGELRISPDLGERTYRDLRTYLNGGGPRPALPSQTAVAAMTANQRATVRRLAEQTRAWAGKLLDLLDQADAIGPGGESKPGDAAVTPLDARRAP